jgi:hypothetical protein
MSHIMPPQPKKPFVYISVRPKPADVKLLKALHAKLGLDQASLVRLALRALADKEGVKH